MSALKRQGNLSPGTPMKRGREGCLETPDAETLETRDAETWVQMPSRLAKCRQPERLALNRKTETL
ncbi:hypothetical protein DPMN_152081 [Dreissena polymorpha]|uniref:Uncharacterized protein n=1 Tax=Dreissena polymorpha TaxID=45954 RepID=A0A9D4FIA9_DREPO|nr:hypothetical protein DPMN_152081 [Dreissena polymorpha]